MRLSNTGHLILGAVGMTEPAIDILSQRLADSEIDPQLRDGRVA